MSKSLNNYASRVAQIIGQPDNVFIKERIKDSIKDYFAKYIIQSIDRNGIQEFYKLNLVVTLVGIEATKIVYGENTIYVDYKSINKVPKPLNIKNDAPFTKVCITNTTKYFTYKTANLFNISLSSLTLPSTWSSRIFTYKDDYLYIKRKYPEPNNIVTTNITSIEVEGLWENPEEILGYYSIDDNQDLDLPFPNEMMNIVLVDLLKTEFGIVPKDFEVEKL